jgi:tetratricopeptide (TPR) repeat protein
MGEERIIPPPPPARLREGDILGEIPDTLGLVLWQYLRHLRDWADASPEARIALFSPATPLWVAAKRKEARALAGELSEALGVFASLVDGPTAVSASAAADACVRVVEWALARDHVQTAVEWAEMAALIDPENPGLANLAGRVTRNADLYDRSEAWFRRGIGYARLMDDKVELTRAHLGYGTLCKLLGRVRCARRHLNSGSQLARKHGPPWLAAGAQHDLLTVLTLWGLYADAEQRAHRALALYPKSHPRIPLFAADAALLLVLERRFSAAARVLSGVLRLIREPAPRGVVLALTARALAGAGRADEAESCRRRALKLLEKHRRLEPVTRWHLADALRLSQQWEAARAEATIALERAMADNDREIERLARRTLRNVEAHRAAAPRGLGTDPERRAFVETLCARLAEWAPRRARPSRPPWGSDWAA